MRGEHRDSRALSIMIREHVSKGRLSQERRIAAENNESPFAPLIPVLKHGLRLDDRMAGPQAARLHDTGHIVSDEDLFQLFGLMAGYDCNITLAAFGEDLGKLHRVQDHRATTDRVKHLGQFRSHAGSLTRR